MQRERRRTYRRQYYAKNRVKLCKCTLQYADRAIERISYGNRIQVQELYQKYPFEQLGESCFKVMRKKFAIYQSSYAYDECYSVGMKAYMYTICQCSLKKDSPDLIRRYLYVIMRAYFICVLNIIDETKIICQENHLRQIDSSHYTI